MNRSSLVVGKVPSRLLILCVDRDDDIGVKARLKTPLVGRDQCLEAATKLAMADPEEADANAIFAALRQYDESIKKGMQCDIAIMAGKWERGFEADQKLAIEFQEILEKSKSDGVILVSDGVDDDSVIPIIQNTLPVVSVSRVVVRHSRSLEESYAVLGRYLRLLVYDPRYSKFALGVPGLLLLVSGVLILFDLGRIAMIVSLAIIGAALIMRGFDIDKHLSGMTRMRPSGYIRLFSGLGSLFVMVTALSQGFSALPVVGEYAAVVKEPGLILKYGPYLMGLFLLKSIDLLWIGLGLNFAGILLAHWIRSQRVKMLRDIVGLLVLVLLYAPLLSVSLILTGQGNTVTLVTFILMGLAVTFIAVTVVYQYLLGRRSRMLA